MISVIVPVYNVEPYIKEALDSLINQSYADLDIILVNDGSPDQSGVICDTYAAWDSRVRVIHQPNAGVGAARNAGLDAARGDYVAFLDPDDVMHPRLLETLRMAMPVLRDTGHTITMVQSSRSRRDVKRETGDNVSVTDLTPTQVLTRMFGATGHETTEYWVVWNKLYPAQMLRGHRFPQSTHSEDTLFNIPLYQQCERVRLITERFYFFRPRVGSATMTSASLSAYKTLLVYPDMLKFFPDLSTEVAACVLTRGMKITISACYHNRWNARRATVNRLHKQIRKQIERPFVTNPHISKRLKAVLLVFLHCPALYALFIWMMEMKARHWGRVLHFVRNPREVIARRMRIFVRKYL